MPGAQPPRDRRRSGATAPPLRAAPRRGGRRRAPERRAARVGEREPDQRRVRQPDRGPAEAGGEVNRIPRVGEEAEQRGHVPDLGRGEDAAPAQHPVGHVVPGERVGVVPHLDERAEQDGHVAAAHRPERGPSGTRSVRVRREEKRQTAGEQIRLGAAPLLGPVLRRARPPAAPRTPAARAAGARARGRPRRGGTAPPTARRASGPSTGPSTPFSAATSSGCARRLTRRKRRSPPPASTARASSSNTSTSAPRKS